MQTAMNTETKTAERPGVVYRTACQNPGCGATFDLRITPENASLLERHDGLSAMPQAWRDAQATGPAGEQAVRGQTALSGDRGGLDAGR